MRHPLVVTILIAAFAMSALGAGAAASLKAGKADLKSVGPLAFGPDGVLFVGDPLQASVYALDTADSKEVKGAAGELTGVGAKIAALLGTTEDQILINDMEVNPLSKRAYFSVSRGRGPDALPAIVRTGAAGRLELLSLENIPHSSVALPNAPAADAKDRRGNPVRVEAITDLAFVNGKVVVAGLSNEEFASNLRSIPYPFASADRGTSVEIFHGAHGRFETNAPVRTFTQYKIANKDHLLAAYTCTPLVAFPVSDLQPGKKVMGKTIAELGNRNRPLDMIVYSKGGANYILMNNSSRGVMKIKGDNLEGYEAITKQTDITGVPYETLADLKGVDHLSRLDDGHALILVKQANGSMDLKPLALP
jgi:hypothetical protein